MLCRAFLPRIATKCATVPRFLTAHIHQWATVSCVSCVVPTRQLHNTTNKSNRSKRGRIADGNPKVPPFQASRHATSAHGNSPRSRSQRLQNSAAGDQGHRDVPHAAAVTPELLCTAATTTKERQGVFGGTLPPWQRFGGKSNTKWDRIPWKDDEDGTAYIEAMVGKNYHEIKCGKDGKRGPTVSYMDLRGVPPLVKLMGHEEDTSHFVSSGTRGCYDAAVKELTAPSTELKCSLLVVGNPGIGKSRCLMYLLRRLLVEHYANCALVHNTHVVVLDDQESGAVCAIVWCCKDGTSEGKWRVCQCDRCDFRVSMCGALDNEDTVYIVDAANESSSGAHAPTVVDARRIYVSSPNPANFHRYKKESMILFMPMWELDELIGAYEHGLEGGSRRGLGDAELTFGGQTAAQCNCCSAEDRRTFHRDVIRYRYDRVGGAVRYVLLNERYFTQRFDDIKNLLNDLDGVALLQGLLGSIISESKYGVPRNFIRYMPSPDGSFWFDDIQKAILSPYVQKEFFTKCQGEVTTAFVSRRSDDGPFLGNLFEKLVILVVERAVGRTVTFEPLPRPGTGTPPSTSCSMCGRSATSRVTS